MKLTMPGYLLLVLAIILLIYFIFIGRVFLLTQGLDAENRVSKSQKNITVSIPKQARVGAEIEVVVSYYPNLFDSLIKQELKQIIFYDSTNAHSYKNSLNLAEVSNTSLGLLPYYKAFTYKVPQQVCPKKEVYDTCQLVSTKTGRGTITLIYEPAPLKFLSGEGYQGDGEKIELPLNIIK